MSSFNLEFKTADTRTDQGLFVEIGKQNNCFCQDQRQISGTCFSVKLERSPFSTKLPLMLIFDCFYANDWEVTIKKMSGRNHLKDFSFFWTNQYWQVSHKLKSMRSHFPQTRIISHNYLAWTTSIADCFGLLLTGISNGGPWENIFGRINK